jgi:hypothetical protein
LRVPSTAGVTTGGNKTTYMVDGKRMSEMEYRVYITNMKNKQARQLAGLNLGTPNRV